MTARFASSLTRRIVFLNLGGLVALAVAFLYVNQFREGLIDARVLSLETQSEIIAAAISASATVNTDAIQLDPEKLLQLAPGQAAKAAEEARASASSMRGPQGRKKFFFEKKNQKTFFSAAADSMNKSFLLLFFKKEGLPYSAC